MPFPIPPAEMGLAVPLHMNLGRFFYLENERGYEVFAGKISSVEIGLLVKSPMGHLWHGIVVRTEDGLRIECFFECEHNIEMIERGFSWRIEKDNYPTLKLVLV